MVIGTTLHITTPASLPKRRALLVGLALSQEPAALVDEHLDELEALTESAGSQVAARAVQRRSAPSAATLIGHGKAEELAGTVDELNADLVVFDNDLSPGQVKKLEEILDVQVLDRSGLILELFHQRARSREARTQVELAQLEYLLPRLTRRWTHLSRQIGGIGVRGGEGETQLEADRRAIKERIRRLKKDLSRIERTRAVQRRRRERVPTVAMAGYTNAGKSTLFNALTRADTYVQDRLFATLDSKLRRGAVSAGHVVVFADTVGFLRKLPHHLVASFRSTLEEVAEADLVLHVVDRAHPQWRDQRRVGVEVLADLGVEPERVLTVYNKQDLWNGTGIATPEKGAVAVSSTTGTGLDDLKEAIASRLENEEATA